MSLAQIVQTLAPLAAAMLLLWPLHIVQARPGAVTPGVVVLSVHDGDTVTVQIGRRTERVRLWGIDAPELGQPYGRAARDRLEVALTGRSVSLREHGRDRYGRLLAEVMLGGRSANQLLVEQGLAWWYRRYAPAASELERAEAGARGARRGLWADLSPVAPWEWRHGGR